MMTMLKMLTIDKDAPWEGFDECLRHLINVRSDGWSGWQTKEKEQMRWFEKQLPQWGIRASQ